MEREVLQRLKRLTEEASIIVRPNAMSGINVSSRRRVRWHR
jgi:hypothetical protein